MRKNILLAFMISISIILASCSQEKIIEQNNANVTLIVKTVGNTTKENFVVTRANALQLLENKHNVKLIRNKLVKCIDEICSGEDYYWTFYVNNKFILSSADRYYPINNDIVEFRFENLGGDLR